MSIFFFLYVVGWGGGGEGEEGTIITITTYIYYIPITIANTNQFYNAINLHASIVTSSSSELNTKRYFPQLCIELQI